MSQEWLDVKNYALTPEDIKYVESLSVSSPMIQHEEDNAYKSCVDDIERILPDEVPPNVVVVIPEAPEAKSDPSEQEQTASDNTDKTTSSTHSPSVNVSDKKFPIAPGFYSALTRPKSTAPRKDKSITSPNVGGIPTTSTPVTVSIENSSSSIVTVQQTTPVLPDFVSAFKLTASSRILCQMAEEIDFQNGHFQNFAKSVTLS